METSQGPEEPQREGFVADEVEEGSGPDVHTSPDEGHPAGEGERSDRDIGGPTSPTGGGAVEEDDNDEHGS